MKRIVFLLLVVVVLAGCKSFEAFGDFGEECSGVQLSDFQTSIDYSR